MKTLSFKKIAATESGRFYKLSESIFEAPNESFILRDEIKQAKKSLLEDKRHWIGNSIRYVCISGDSIRLAYPTNNRREKSTPSYEIVEFSAVIDRLPSSSDEEKLTKLALFNEMNCLIEE